MAFASEEPENSWVREGGDELFFDDGFEEAQERFRSCETETMATENYAQIWQKFRLPKLWKSWLRNRFSVKKKLPLSYP